MRFLVTMLLVLWAVPALARPVEDAPGRACSRGVFGPVMCIRTEHFVHDTCRAIEVQARRHGLSPGFFARLIWQESRFDRNALSHAYAMGIAQFIASTAAKRRLKDPFNPAQALEHSAEYLGELQRRYGNPGLAALAYNGGEKRADGFLRNRGILQETIDYVIIITGLRAEDWRDDPPEHRDFRLSKSMPFQSACVEMAKGRRTTALPTLYYQPGDATRSQRPRVRPEPKLGKWGAQLAFGTSQARAKANFIRRTRFCRRIVGQSPDIIFVANRVKGRRGYWMARISHMQRDVADDTCRKARAKGCICAVYRNW